MFVKQDYSRHLDIMKDARLFFKSFMIHMQKVGGVILFCAHERAQVPSAGEARPSLNRSRL